MIKRFHAVSVARKRSSRLWSGALGAALVLTIFSSSILAAEIPAAAASSPQSLAKSYGGSFSYSDGGVGAENAIRRPQAASLYS
jgi:hypothetical protein